MAIDDLFKFSIGDTLMFNAPNNCICIKALVVDRVLDIIENVYQISHNNYSAWHREGHFDICRMVLVEKQINFPEQINFPKPLIDYLVI